MSINIMSLKFYSRLTILLTFMTILIVMPAAVFAQAADSTNTVESDTTAIAAKENPALKVLSGSGLNMGEIVGKMIGYLFLIIMLIFGVVYVLKKFVYNRKEMFGKENVIRVISSTFVAPKKSLMMVEVFDKLLILSVTDNNMSYVTELSKEEYESRLNTDGDEKNTDRLTNGQFGDMFNRILKRTK